MIAALTSIVGIIPVVTGFGIIYFAISSIKKLIIELSDKEITGNLKGISSTLKAINSLLLGITFSIVALSITIAATSPAEVLLAFGLVTAIVGGSLILINQLAKIKKAKLDESRKTLQTIAYVFAIISVTAALALIPVGKHIGKAILGAILVSGIVELGILALKQLSKMPNKKLDESRKTLLVITGVFGAIALMSNFLLVPIGENFKSILLGATAVLIIEGLLIGGVYLLTKMKKKDLEQARKTLITLTAVFGAIALITNFILRPIGQDATNALQGAVITLGVLGLLIAGVWLLSKVDTDNMTKALLYTVSVTIIYLGIGLIIKNILMPIGDKAKEAAFGSMITLGVLMALIAGIWLLSKIDLDNMAKSILYTAGMTIMYLGVGLIIKNILMPIGDNAKDAIYGSLITLGVLMALISGVWLLSKVKATHMIKSLLVVAGLAMILLGISLITKEILIPIGKNAEDAALGALAVAGIITGFGAIFGAIGWVVTKFSSLLEYIVVGGAFSVLLGGLAAILSGEVYLVSKAAAGITELNQDNAVVKGLEMMAAILGGITLVFGALGALSMAGGGLGALVILIGGVVVDALGLFADVLAAQIWAIARIGKSIFDMNQNDAIIKGFDSMVKVIGKIGVIILELAGLAVLSIPAIAAEGVIAFTVPIMMGLSNIISHIMRSINLTAGLTDNEIKDAAIKMGTMIGLIKSTIKQLASIDAGDAIEVGFTMMPIRSVFSSLDTIVEEILKINAKLTKESITDFRSIVVGETKDDENSVIGSIISIINKFDEISFLTALGVNIISRTIRPVIDTISQWIDVIIKVGTMSYIIGYDENGKPMYEHLPATVFKDAATSVTTGFSDFLQSLQTGFHGLSIVSTAIMASIVKNIRPIIDTISQWIDVIMKVGTGTYIIGYDENGKPEYEHMTAKDFSDAATAVTT